MQLLRDLVNYVCMRMCVCIYVQRRVETLKRNSAIVSHKLCMDDKKKSVTLERIVEGLKLYSWAEQLKKRKNYSRNA